MAESKAKKSKKNNKKDNKNLIACVCAAVAAVVIIVITIIAINANKGLSDAYFVSDDSKYVLTLDMSGADGESTDADEEEQYTPNKIHYVYTYSGDEITGLKYYYEYDDNGTAKSASEYIIEQQGDDNSLSDIHADGKYVVATASEELYKDYTASDIKKQIDFYESLQNMNLGDDETESEVVEDTTEENSDDAE